jgi:DNA-binding transcriptional LysR family regulator
MFFLFSGTILDKLQSIEAFVAVARAGGFSAASRQLGSPVATVSRKVALLEEAVGVRLLARSTRHVALTEQGKTYFEACRRVLDDLHDADELIAGEYRQPKGELTLTAPVGFGRRHLQPVVHEFLAAYPLIDVNLKLADRVVGLVEEHVDCAVRISAMADSSLIAREVGHIRIVVCASPAYLAAHGTPSRPQELLQHQCISWTTLGPYKAWEFRLASDKDSPVAMMPIRVRLSSTTPDSAVDAARAGLGLVQATSYQVAEAVREGTLVPVLRGFEAPPTPVSLVYPSKRLTPLKLRAFLDFVAPRLSSRLDEVARILNPL